MSPIIRSRWEDAKVLENKRWTDRLYSLRLERESMPFKAGQFVSLRLPIEQEDGETKVVAKSYSLINAPHEKTTEIFYNIVPEGRLSNALANLKAGETVEISQPPQGFFVLDEVPDVPNLWMVATGTGLGPYLSMLKTDQPWERFRNIRLVHGVPLNEELAYADLIQALADERPEQFRFISCISREDNPEGLTGRVTTNLASGALEETAGLTIYPEDTHVMLCGNHNMINEMKELLGTRGMQRHLRHKPGHITTEQYF